MITSILFTKYSLLIDLHVLSILSAFILSQDQTLHSILFTPLIFFLKLFDRNCITLFLFSSFWFAFLLILLFCFYCPFVMQNLFRIDKNYITTLYYSLSTTFFNFFCFYLKLYFLFIFFHYFFYIRWKIIWSFYNFPIFSIYWFSIFI